MTDNTATRHRRSRVREYLLRALEARERRELEEPEYLDIQSLEVVQPDLVDLMERPAPLWYEEHGDTASPADPQVIEAPLPEDLRGTPSRAIKKRSEKEKAKRRKAKEERRLAAEESLRFTIAEDKRIKKLCVRVLRQRAEEAERKRLGIQQAALLESPQGDPRYPFQRVPGPDYVPLSSLYPEAKRARTDLNTRKLTEGENAMRNEELVDRFQRYRTRAENQELHSGIHDRALDLACWLNDRVPDCREKSVAIKELEDFCMWANAAVGRRLGHVHGSVTEGGGLASDGRFYPVAGTEDESREPVAVGEFQHPPGNVEYRCPNCGDSYSFPQGVGWAKCSSPGCSGVPVQVE